MGAIRKTVNIEYKGKSYDCVADFRFINTVEQRVNIGLFETQAKAGTVQFSDIAWVVYAALKPHESGLSYHDVGDELLGNIEEYSQHAGNLLAAALTAEPIGDVKKKKVRKAS